MEAKSQSQSPGRKVLAIRTGDGGVELQELGVKSFMAVTEQWAKDRKLSMELDKSLGGVVLHYLGREQGKEVPRTILIPMAHLRRVDLAEQ